MATSAALALLAVWASTTAPEAAAAAAGAADAPVRLAFGAPTPVGGGGKMSNTLDMWPAGFASGMGSPVVFSVDGGDTFQRARFNQSANRSWDSFVVVNGTDGVRAHDFGTYHECIPGQTQNGAHATPTSVVSQPTMSYRFVGGQLTETLGPSVSFGGLPADEPICGPPKDDPAFVGMTVYAGGQLVLADGTHLVTTMYPVCLPGKPRDGGIHIFSSSDGYNFTFVSHVARQSDNKIFAAPAEGPNEHSLALLPDGSILCVFRTEAGDGNGRCECTRAKQTLTLLL